MDYNIGQEYKNENGCSLNTKIEKNPLEWTSITLESTGAIPKDIYEKCTEFEATVYYSGLGSISVTVDKSRNATNIGYHPITNYYFSGIVRLDPETRIISFSQTHVSGCVFGSFAVRGR